MRAPIAIDASDEQQGQPGRRPAATSQPLSLEPSLPLPLPPVPPVPPVPPSMNCATRESAPPAPLSAAGGLVVVPPSCSGFVKPPSPNGLVNPASPNGFVKPPSPNGFVKPPSKKGICAWAAEVPVIVRAPKNRASN